MKILVLSDSHGDVKAMLRAVARFSPDSVIHLGDHIRDAEQLQKSLGNRPLYCVPGNCDFGSDAPEVVQFSMDGVRFFITHGHRHGVKFTPLRAVLAAQEAEAKILCFGHTHRQMYEMHGGLHVLNPGACSGVNPKCALITIDNGAVCCALHELGGDNHDPGN
ncbi:MAG: metallophosphoesterase [Ruminococcaceae bacterium]|nr:metallophosphoesterase [Oscillospiraceae bacterium]